MARFARLTSVLALAAIVLAGCVGGDEYEFQGGTLEPLSTTADFQLTDQNGEPWTMSEQTGKVVLLYFGYTTCPDACPTTLSDWIEVKRLLGEDADKVEFVMVTVDPERDDQAKLNQYMAFFDPEFYGLTGDAETLEGITRDYGIMAVREEHPESATGYLMNHTTSFWVVDTENKLRLVFAHGTDPEIVAEDVEHLL